MAEETAVAKTEQKLSLVQAMALRFNMEPRPFLDSIKQTVFPNAGVNASDAMVAAFLAVAHEYGLNPFTRELFAFPNKGGGIVPIVSIDGWVNLIVRHPQYNGMDLAWEIGPDSKPVSCTCTIYRKDIEHATPITEYYDECFRNTEPWNKMPKRMLRHKAIKEAGRVTFGFSGLYDEDEASDVINITAESTVLERSTETRTENLKTKLDAKKKDKEKAKEPEAPKQPEPPPAAPEPPSAPPLVDTITEEQRKQFIDALDAHSKSKGKGTADAIAAGKAILAELGISNSRLIPATMFDEIIRKAKEW